MTLNTVLISTDKTEGKAHVTVSPDMPFYDPVS